MEIQIAVNEGSANIEGAEEPKAGPESTAEAKPERRPASEKVRLGPGEERSDEELQRELATLLFASREPLSTPRLVELLERPTPARVEAALERMQAELEAGSATGLPLVLKKIAGAWHLVTDPELATVVARLRTEPKPERISAAALETLAIIAYRQPVSKAEIEAIRGVQAGPVLRALVDRGLVRITGRADLPGQPLLYGTTKDFLDRFGLSGLKDLPRDGELNED